MDGFQLLNIITACVFLSSTLRNNQFIEYLMHRHFDSITVLLNQLNGKQDDFKINDDTEENDGVDDIPNAGATTENDDADDTEVNDVAASAEEDDVVDTYDDDDCDDSTPSSNNTITDLIIKFFFIYTNCLHQTYKLCEAIYQYHPVSTEAIDILYYYAQCVSGYYMDYRVEPFSKNWTSVLVHTRHTHDAVVNVFYPSIPMHTTQLTEYIEPVYSTNKSLLQLGVFAKNIRELTPIMQTTNMIPDFIDAMLLCYYDNRYISKVIHPTAISNQIDIDTNAPRSRVSFLSITYNHPDQTAHIPIDLPRNMFYTGNEILSSAFIKRYLEYNHTHYIMNEEYTIQIMDNMLQTFDLDNTQYVLLKERAYVVMSR